MRAFVLALSLIAASATAADRSPVGTWKTIDDETHQPKAIVEIAEHDGALSGRVVELFRKPGEDQNPKCKDCAGDRKDQPIIGMTILWNLHRDGDEWNGGEIIDPDGGKIYRCKLRVDDTGAKLEVRGFIGFSLLGRTQVWERASASASP
jgi:uncharacterized protein (DUF2147 family)